MLCSSDYECKVTTFILNCKFFCVFFVRFFCMIFRKSCNCAVIRKLYVYTFFDCILQFYLSVISENQSIGSDVQTDADNDCREPIEIL